MRLTQTQIEGITRALDPFMKKGELYLFGSRVDDTLKGGDIDLLIITQQPKLEHLQQQKYAMLAAIKMRIGDQKIDLVITDPAGLIDPFIQEAYQRALLLKKWPT